MSCRACGNSDDWCRVYTGCPLNKGNAHDLVSSCIVVKGKQYKHLFVYSGVEDERHCVFCRTKEGA